MEIAIVLMFFPLCQVIALISSEQFRSEMDGQRATIMHCTSEGLHWKDVYLLNGELELMRSTSYL